MSDEMRRQVANMLVTAMAEDQVDLAGTRSIAVLDRSTIHRACALVTGGALAGRTSSQGQAPGVDPFVGFADLASVINASIFYDHILVFHPSDALRDELAPLGLEGLVTRLDPSRRPGATPAAHLLSFMMDDQWKDALRLVFNSEQMGEDWVRDLKQHWRHLLPELTDVNLRIPGLELDRATGTYEPTGAPTSPLFCDEQGNWVLNPDLDLAGMARENTYRGMFYLQLSRYLSDVLSHADDRVHVGYVGGCLRTPVQLAVLRASFTDPPPAHRYFESMRQGRMPLCVDAVLGECERAEDLPAAIAKYRAIAKPIRRARADIELAAMEGYTDRLVDLQRAVTQEIDGVARKLADGAAESAMTVATWYWPLASVARPLLPGAVKGLVSSYDRLFRPHVFAVQRLVDAANDCRRSFHRAARIFRIPKSLASAPLGFLTRLKDVAWVL